MRAPIVILYLLLLTAALLAGGVLGCGPSNEFTATPIPNALPDSRVTARPPQVLEAGFIVEFHWTGFDPDGRVAGYQWRISNNGTDGISVQDTITFDPVTGDTLNPWFDIASTDSVFFVSADIPDFPDDPDGYNRSYQTHTFWVRTVDDDDGTDPSPAMVSFTSTTLLPNVVIDGPTAVTGQLEAAQLPSTVTFLYTGDDPDFGSGVPVRVRYLWKKAVLPDGNFGDTRIDFANNLEYLVAFDDSAWTDWQRYETSDELRRVVLPGQLQTEPDPDVPGEDRNIYYAFAIQVQDTAGAVSIGRRYGYQVANVRITQTLRPTLRISEQFLGDYGGAGINLLDQLDIAAGQELNFSWSGDATGYAGEITNFRYGWDVNDPDDPNDPNWAILPGNSAQHRRAPVQSFASGVHTFTVTVTDNSEQTTRQVITLDVVPVPDPADQLPLLWVDDVNDRTSNAWGGPFGQPRDRDEFRDEFWTVALGGVAGFNPGRDVVDAEVDEIEYRDVVQYRTLVWAGRWVSSPHSAIARDFRPLGGSADAPDDDQYIWLQPYQATVGNVLFAGSRAMNNFLAESSYELPIVFQSREGEPSSGYTFVGNGVPVRRGFGEREMPDGTTVQVGVSRYPYLTMGVATIDLMSPTAAYYEYGHGQQANTQRRNACAAMKGVVVDSVFRATYMPGGGVFGDTIWSDSESIDWQDVWGPRYTDENHPDYVDPLQVSYVWKNDEFYDADVIGRGTNYSLQECDDRNCVEPMFRSISRYDWVQMNQIAEGHADWPLDFYDGQGQPTLDSVCGPRSLSLDLDRAITSNRIVGFIARKTAPNKPSQVGDVVLGFDPYRFDTDEMVRVIRWVLGEHFGLSMTP